VTVRTAVAFKLILGVVAFTPVAMASFYGLAQLWQNSVTPKPEVALASSTAAELAVWGLLVGLLIGCIALVFRLPSVVPEKRVAWVVFLILFSIVAIPAFWYSHVYLSHPSPVPSSDL
jgi:hypothetical protein